MPRPLRVVSFGECMLELQGQAFGAMQQSYGGDSLNTAVYLARCGQQDGQQQGLQVDFATALGDDPLSDGLLARWQADGLATGLVRRIPGKLPGLYLIEVDGQGERRFSYWRGQSAARDYFDTAPGATPLEQQADQIDALYISGISLAILPPAGRSRLLALAQQLNARGALVAFDNNYRPRLWASVEEARACFGQMLAVASVALLTLDDELALWGGPGGVADVEDAARQQAQSLDTPCAEVVIKRGAAATLVRVAGGAVAQVPTVPVPQVVDTTAAGDSFAGAYLAARLGGATPVQAAAAGNRLAAQVVQHRGAIMPARAV